MIRLVMNNELEEMCKEEAATSLGYNPPNAWWEGVKKSLQVQLVFLQKHEPVQSVTLKTPAVQTLSGLKNIEIQATYIQHVGAFA